MKDVFLVYDASCFYEIIILNYFMAFSKCDVLLCSPDGRSVRTMEGYSVNVDCALEDVDLTQVRSFVVPGGRIAPVDTPYVWACLRELEGRGALVAGICAGVDVLDHAGILEGRSSTHSTERDVVNDRHVITSRANGYVDFAIETAKELNLFQSEEDLRETVDFWKNYRRMQ